MNKSEAIGELSKALSLAQGEFSGAKKGAANPFFKSKYSDLASIMEAIREPLSKHEISYVQTTRVGEANGIIVETTLMHSSGQWISGELFVPSTKNDPQSFGSALSYGRRYALQAIVGLEAVDDDAEAAQGRPQDKQAKPAQSKAKAPTPQQQNSTSEDPGEVVRGIIEKVSTKTGDKNGKPWTQYSAKINGTWYGTFSETIGSLAQENEGKEVVISYKQQGQFLTIAEIVPVANAA